MKEQVIKILNKYSIKNSDATGEWSIMEDDMFPQVAEEIDKFYKIEHILGSVVFIKENYKNFRKGERCIVVTEQVDNNNNYEYHLHVIDDYLPQRYGWIKKEDIDTFLEFK